MIEQPPKPEPKLQFSTKIKLTRPNPVTSFGTQEHPIPIYNEEEQLSIKEKRLENARNASIIQTAKMSRDPIDIIIALMKTKYRGSIKQKEKAVQHEIASYFESRVLIDITGQFFAEKIWPIAEECENTSDIALMVYGVDFLDTQQIGNMFSVPGQNPKRFVHKIHWKNESNCLVEFFTPEFTEIALKQV